MNEHTRMMEAWTNAQQRGEIAILATIVAVRGSSYRPVGARMLILQDGSRVGALSGGCIEADLCRKAFWWTANGKPHLHTYDSGVSIDEESGQATAEDDFGLGCGGSIDIWLERLDPSDALCALNLIQAVHSNRIPCVRAIYLSSRSAVASTECALDQQGTLITAAHDSLTGHKLIDPQLLSAMRFALKTGLAQTTDLTLSDGSSARVFFDLLRPPVQLNVFGAGLDAVPLVELANQIGWRTAVCDKRSDYATVARFPDASRVLHVRVANDLDPLTFDAYTACVVMAHSFEQDRFFLQYLLGLGLPYIGVLGSRRRTESILAELHTDLISSRIYAPAGLNIGAETPETIAVSIIAEITACFSQRNGGFLRNHPGPIHATVSTRDRIITDAQTGTRSGSNINAEREIAT